MNDDQNRKKPDPPELLAGWKEIAAYLGKGVRTVQRYEIELGLPVRRPAGKPCGSVVATRVELDAWVSASPIREAFHLTRMPDTRASDTADIKRGVLEMSSLRVQMAGLRGELRKSVSLLKESVLALQTQLSRDQWTEKIAPTVLEASSRTKSIMDLLITERKQRRAS
jgi:hypothetical protein